MSRHMQHLACRYHPDAELIEDYRAGDVICSQCGLVVGDRMIDVSTEWRNFENDSGSTSMVRVGAAQNLLYDNDNLETTTIGVTNSRAVTNSKAVTQSSQMSSADKALRTAHDAIRAMAGRINLTKKVTNRAFLIFKHCYEKKCLRGRSQDAVIASCLYIACRKEGSARTIKEIAAISTATPKDIGRCFSKIKQNLPTTDETQSIEIKDLVPRFCNQLELSQEIIVRKAAIHIADRADQICDIQGRAPRSIASAAIYLACLAAHENKTKKDIQVPTGVSEGVIRDVYRIMLPRASELFPADFVFKRPLTALPVS